MAKTRSEEWFAKGLKWGAILGGVLFAAVTFAPLVAGAAGATLGSVIVMAIINGIVGAVFGGATGGILGGISGFFFKKDNERADMQQPPSASQKFGRSNQPSQEPQLAQTQGQATPSTYYRDQVAASRTNAAAQGRYN